MLRFEEIYDYLIFGASYTKAHNSSGMGCAYTICHNKEVQSRMGAFLDLIAAYPSAFSYSILKACYITEEAAKWRKKTTAYINRNYERLKHFCAEHLPKVKIFNL